MVGRWNSSWDGPCAGAGGYRVYCNCTLRSWHDWSPGAKKNLSICGRRFFFWFNNITSVCFFCFLSIPTNTVIYSGLFPQPGGRHRLAWALSNRFYFGRCSPSRIPSQKMGLPVVLGWFEFWSRSVRVLNMCTKNYSFNEFSIRLHCLRGSILPKSGNQTEQKKECISFTKPPPRKKHS